MRAKTAGIADIAQKAAGHAVFANVNHTYENCENS
jgi:hypothetical protein